MKILLPICLLLFSVLLNNPRLLAQQPKVDWNANLCDDSSDIGLGYSIVDTKNHGLVVAGGITSTDSDVVGFVGLIDVWVLRLDSLHNILWKKCYGGTGGQIAYSIKNTKDGGYIFAGQTNSNDSEVSGNHGAQDYWVVKLDSIGNIQWAKCYGGSSTDIAYSIIQTNDGNYLVAGNSNSDDGDVKLHYGGQFTQNIWVVKLDSLGNIVWSTDIGDSTFGFSASSVMQASDGNYVITGSAGDGGYGALLVKLDMAGNIIWKHGYGGDGADGFNNIVESKDGNYVVAGSASSNDGEVSGNHGGYDFWLVKIDTAGNFIWGQCYGGSNDEYAYSLCNTNDNGFALAGETLSDDGQITNAHGSYDYWIVKTDSLGNFSWELDLGGTNADVAESICQDESSNLYITGYSESDNDDFNINYDNDYNLWLTKLSINTGIEPLQNGDPLDIYPNPASNQLTINSNQSLILEIQIKDVLGQTIINKIFSNSFQKQIIDVGALPQGIYFYRVTESDSQVITGKFVKE